MHAPARFEAFWHSHRVEVARDAAWWPATLALLLLAAAVFALLLWSSAAWTAVDAQQWGSEPYRWFIVNVLAPR
jgi:hypothetical protein